MRIVLLYAPHRPVFGTGSGDNPIDVRCLTGDVQHFPHGLLSLAAQALAAGHAVSVLNLFAFAWRDVEAVLECFPAELYGLSCFTSNRRGTLAAAECIRRLQPRAHITVGGPHASALPAELLRHCAALDTIVIGEGEETFMELIARVQQGGACTGIAGTAWRGSGGGVQCRPRPLIAELDRLVPPARYFGDHILLTTRGCPFDCSFCASTLMWGRAYRSLSVARVLDTIGELLGRHAQQALAVKDETFTIDRARVLELCRGIERRGLRFCWSCDTRADTLDAELLEAMRRSGCERISLGVESAAPSVLARLGKRLDREAVWQATHQARAVGLQVRWYLIAGSPGETPETLAATEAFVRAAGSDQVIWNPFTLFPGTRACDEAVGAGLITPENFFSSDLFELQPLLLEAGRPEDRCTGDWLVRHQGLQTVQRPGAAHCRSVLERFPKLPGAHIDLAGALLRDGDPIGAARHARRALALEYPLPGIAWNCLAASAACRGDVRGALSALISAREQGCHRVVEENIERTQAWISSGGPQRGDRLVLEAAQDFEISRPNRQPLSPGPIECRTPDGKALRVQPLGFSTAVQ